MTTIFNPRHPETITVVSEGVIGQDPDYGTDVYGTTRTEVPGCAIYPRVQGSTTEQADGTRAQVVVGLTVLAPWGTVIDPHARVLARGHEWDVVGVPGEWRSAITGHTGAVEIALKRHTG